MSTPIRVLASAAVGGALALALAAPAAAEYGQISTGHELTAECGEVTLTYVNPTPHGYGGDYRLGDEPGTPDDHSDHVPSEGPWAGEPLGDRYNRVSLPAGQTVTVVVEVTEDTTVSYWANRGPENRAYAAKQTVDVVACEDDDDNGDNGDDQGGADKPKYRDTVVVFEDSCDGVGGQIEFGNRKGDYRYSVWQDGELVADKAAGEKDAVKPWDPVEASKVRVTVDHKAKGKKGKWVNVLDVTHKHTLPEDCEDEDVTDPDETDKPDDTDPGDKDKDPGKDKDDDAPAKKGDASTADDSLPVTGGALVALVAAGIAVTGAGGTGLFLARKRKSNAVSDNDE